MSSRGRLFLGPLVDRFGEARLSRFGIVLIVLGLLSIPLAHSIPLFVVASAFLPLGASFTFSCVTSMLSRVISGDERGLYMGVQQTFGGITRVFFPIGAGFLWDSTRPRRSGLLRDRGRHVASGDGRRPLPEGTRVAPVTPPPEIASVSPLHPRDERENPGRHPGSGLVRARERRRLESSGARSEIVRRPSPPHALQGSLSPFHFL